MSEEGKFIITPREIIEDSRLTLWHIKVLLALYSFRNKNTDLVYFVKIALFGHFLCKPATNLCICLPVHFRGSRRRPLIL